MSFPYKCVLMVGATAGIGAAMADRLVQEGAKVIALGRRQERLDEFVKKHGSQKAASVKFDISNTAGLNELVKKVTSEHQELDCVFINAGVQKPQSLADAAKWDASAFREELAVNYTYLVEITMKFLPYLLGKESETSVIFTGANLAIVPGSALSGYSAAKAALNSFVLCLRDQLRNSEVKVIEVSPPAVQTELHDWMGVEKGRALGMPLDQFIEGAYGGIASGKDQIVVGAIGPADTFNEIIDKRRTASENLNKFMRGEK